MYRGEYWTKKEELTRNSRRVCIQKLIVCVFNALWGGDQIKKDEVVGSVHSYAWADEKVIHSLNNQNPDQKRPLAGTGIHLRMILKYILRKCV